MVHTFRAAWAMPSAFFSGHLWAASPSSRWRRWRSTSRLSTRPHSPLAPPHCPRVSHRRPRASAGVRARAGGAPQERDGRHDLLQAAGSLRGGAARDRRGHARRATVAASQACMEDDGTCRSGDHGRRETLNCGLYSMRGSLCAHTRNGRDMMPPLQIPVYVPSSMWEHGALAGDGGS